MRNSAGIPAFLLVVLLSDSFPPLGCQLARRRSAPASPFLPGRSHLPAAKAACALPDRCVGQASAGKSDEFHPVEIRQSPAVKPSSGPAIVDSICNALVAAATEGDCRRFLHRVDLAGEPLSTRRPSAAPARKAWRSWCRRPRGQRGLADPFDPLEAIAQSAKLLRDLRREFGNLGLAAAAYNAGPGRVRDWLAGRRGLPPETGPLCAPRDRPIRRAMDRS